MKKLIIFLFIFVCTVTVAAAQSSFYYEITVHYDNHSEQYLRIESVNIIFSAVPLKEENGNFLLKVQDKETVYSEGRFYIPNALAADSIDPESGEFTEGEIVFLDNTTFTVYAPYHAAATTIAMYNGDNLLDEENVLRFSKNVIKNDSYIPPVPNDAPVSDVHQKNYYLIIGFIVILLIGLIILLRKFLFGIFK
ncbi:MAG: hypothetical protein RL557_965 [archaeon]|jgi:hypothetical protein